MRIDRVDSEAELLGTPASSAEIVKVIAGDFEVRLANSAAEVEAAQALRFRVFFEEMAARPTAEIAATRRDFDAFDEVCDHLLVLDRRRGEGPEGIVGTYRLIRRPAAAKIGRFYSSAEYDIRTMIDYPGEVLELGRSCIERDARNTATMQMLWRGIALYAFHYNIQVMFGCASLPGTDPSQHALPLSYLYHHHLAPREIRARALPERYVDMNMLEPGSYDARKAMARVPPLIKGYLRLGGFVGDGAVIDPEFNTTDVFIVVKTELVTEKYIRHYERGIRDQHD
ncbi:MAG: GNAT family N-acetyltransferase [Alphaproteobacteria bacterium]|nr:GNAT family N-acetyltransferase [Alphaproteobacteria bacterium]